MIVGIIGTLSRSIIIFRVVPITIAILTPLTILYISNARIL